MRWYLLSLIVLLGTAYHCGCEEKKATAQTAQKTNSLSSAEAPLAGIWRWDIPEADEPNAFVEVRLSDDRTWSWSGHSDSPRSKPDQSSGTWFVHDRTLVLRISKTDIRLLKNMAYTFDIKDVAPKSMLLTNTPLGNLTWKRQQDVR